MADLLRTGTAWLAGKLKAVASQAVSYRRGSASVSLHATVGSSLLKVTDTFGNVQVVRTERDYLFTAADLVLSGIRTTPQRGDVIDDATSGVTAHYEILAPDGEPPWRYSDPAETMIRVHTKKVAS